MPRGPQTGDHDWTSAPLRGAARVCDTQRTLRSFVSSYWDLVGIIDDLLIPDPDVKA